MIRLLHLADVHLGAPLGGFGGEAEVRAAEVLDAFRALPELAVENEAHAVLIAGDLFDGPRPSDGVVIAVRETVRRLLDRAIPVFAVPGNHDARALAPDLYGRALEGATVFEEPRFAEPIAVETGPDALFVYGFAYDAAEELDPLASFRRAGSEGIHVAVLHGSIPGAPHWQRGSALGLSWEGLAALEADYLALGDLHRFRGPDELQGLPACYPGSFAAVDFTESGTRGAVLVELGSGAPRITRLSSGVREVGALAVVDVSEHASDAEIADAIDGIADADAYPVIELLGEPSFPLDADAVKAILEERYGAAALVDSSRFFEAGRLEEIARTNTVAGHIARLGLERVASAETEGDRAAAERGLRIALRVLEVA